MVLINLFKYRGEIWKRSLNRVILRVLSKEFLKIFSFEVFLSQKNNFVNTIQVIHTKFQQKSSNHGETHVIRRKANDIKWYWALPAIIDRAQGEGVILLLSPSAITRSKYIGGNRVNWTYYANWYIELQPKFLTLQYTIYFALLFYGIYLCWTKPFVPKTELCFILFLIWFGVLFGVTALKALN